MKSSPTKNFEQNFDSLSEYERFLLFVHAFNDNSYFKWFLFTMINSADGNDLENCNFYCLHSQISKIIYSYQILKGNVDVKKPRSIRKNNCNIRMKLFSDCKAICPHRNYTNILWIFDNICITTNSLSKIDVLESIDDVLLLPSSALCCIKYSELSPMLLSLNSEAKEMTIHRTNEDDIRQHKVKNLTSNDSEKIKERALEKLIVLSAASLLSCHLFCFFSFLSEELSSQYNNSATTATISNNSPGSEKSKSIQLSDAPFPTTTTSTSTSTSSTLQNLLYNIPFTIDILPLYHHLSCSCNSNNNSNNNLYRCQYFNNFWKNASRSTRETFLEVILDNHSMRTNKTKCNNIKCSFNATHCSYNRYHYLLLHIANLSKKCNIMNNYNINNYVNKNINTENNIFDKNSNNENPDEDQINSWTNNGDIVERATTDYNVNNCNNSDDNNLYQITDQTSPQKLSSVLEDLLASHATGSILFESLTLYPIHYLSGYSCYKIWISKCANNLYDYWFQSSSEISELWDDKESGGNGTRDVPEENDSSNGGGSGSKKSKKKKKRSGRVTQPLTSSTMTTTTTTITTSTIVPSISTSNGPMVNTTAEEQGSQHNATIIIGQEAVDDGSSVNITTRNSSPLPISTDSTTTTTVTIFTDQLVNLTNIIDISSTILLDNTTSNNSTAIPAHTDYTLLDSLQSIVHAVDMSEIVTIHCEYQTEKMKVESMSESQSEAGNKDVSSTNVELDTNGSSQTNHDQSEKFEEFISSANSDIVVDSLPPVSTLCNETSLSITSIQIIINDKSTSSSSSSSSTDMIFRKSINSSNDQYKLFEGIKDNNNNYPPIDATPSNDSFAMTAASADNNNIPGDDATSITTTSSSTANSVNNHMIRFGSFEIPIETPGSVTPDVVSESSLSTAVPCHSSLNSTKTIDSIPITAAAATVPTTAAISTPAAVPLVSADTSSTTNIAITGPFPATTASITIVDEAIFLGTSSEVILPRKSQRFLPLPFHTNHNNNNNPQQSDSILNYSSYDRQSDDNSLTRSSTSSISSDTFLPQILFGNDHKSLLATAVTNSIAVRISAPLIPERRSPLQSTVNTGSATLTGLMLSSSEHGDYSSEHHRRPSPVRQIKGSPALLAPIHQPLHSSLSPLYQEDSDSSDDDEEDETIKGRNPVTIATTVTDSGKSSNRNSGGKEKKVLENRPSSNNGKVFGSPDLSSKSNKGNTHNNSSSSLSPPSSSKARVSSGQRKSNEINPLKLSDNSLWRSSEAGGGGSVSIRDSTGSRSSSNRGSKRRPRSIPRIFTGLLMLGGEPESSPLDLLQTDKQLRLTEMLTKDVQDMAEQLSDIAIRRRPWQEAAVARVRNVVTSIWPQAHLDVFGSCFTPLAIPASDVDIVVSCLPSSFKNKITGRGGVIAILSEALRSQLWVSSVQALERTLMPIIKITTGPTPVQLVPGQHSGVSYTDATTAAASNNNNNIGLSSRGLIRVDISFDLSTTPNSPSSFSSPSFAFDTVILRSPPFHRGLVTRDFIARLCTMNPSLAPLVVVLKQLLVVLGLLDPYTGGLPSYALTIMVGSLLQPHALEPPDTHPDLGSLLLAFLRQYSTAFDTRKYAVCMSTRGPLIPLAPGGMPSTGGSAQAHVPRVGTPEYWRPADPVVVLDPLNPSTNLGRSCFGFRHIQNALDAALKAVERFVSSGGLEQAECSDQLSALGVVFGAQHHNHVVRLTAQMWCPFQNRPDYSSLLESRYKDHSGGSSGSSQGGRYPTSMMAVRESSINNSNNSNSNRRNDGIIATNASSRSQPLPRPDEELVEENLDELGLWDAQVETSRLREEGSAILTTLSGSRLRSAVDFLRELGLQENSSVMGGPI